MGTGGSSPHTCSSPHSPHGSMWGWHHMAIEFGDPCDGRLMVERLWASGPQHCGQDTRGDHVKYACCQELMIPTEGPALFQSEARSHLPRLHVGSHPWDAGGHPTPTSTLGKTAGAPRVLKTTRATLPPAWELLKGAGGYGKRTRHWVGGPGRRTGYMHTLKGTTVCTTLGHCVLNDTPKSECGLRQARGLQVEMGNHLGKGHPRVWQSSRADHWAETETWTQQMVMMLR